MDLPEPLRPTRQMRSPAATDSSAPSSSGAPPRVSWIFWSERRGAPCAGFSRLGGRKASSRKRVCRTASTREFGPLRLREHQKGILMSDIVVDSALQTAAVMDELVCKAREAHAQGESRRSFFARTAKLAGATALGAAGVNLLQPMAARAATATASSDTVQDILNIACTAEALAITFYHKALQNTAQLPNVNSAANRSYFQAALVQESEHFMFLHANGGHTLASQFYFPADMFNKESVFFPTASTLEDYFISAYIAAALDFSGAYSSGITTASPTLIGVAVQIAGVESEHRALLNVAANINPPNNRIIESALLQSVSDAVAPLTPFLQGGSGFVGPFNVPNISGIDFDCAALRLLVLPEAAIRLIMRRMAGRLRPFCPAILSRAIRSISRVMAPSRSAFQAKVTPTA